MSVDDTKLYCTCRSRYDGEKFMLSCDLCPNWFHGVCTNISEDEVPNTWFCDNCTALNNMRKLLLKDMQELLVQKDQTQLQKIDQLLDMHESQTTSLKNTVSEKEKVIDQLRREFEQLSTDYNLKLEECSVSNRDLKLLSSKIEEKDQVIDQLRREFEQLSTDYNLKLEECSVSNRDVKLLSSKIEEKDQVIDQLRREFEQLSNDNNLKLEECSVSNRDVKLLSSKIEEKDQVINKLNEECSDLKRAFELLAADSESQLKQKDEVVQTLQADLRSLSINLDEVKKDLREYEKACDIYSVNPGEKDEVIRKLTEENNDLKSQLQHEMKKRRLTLKNKSQKQTE